MPNIEQLLLSMVTPLVSYPEQMTLQIVESNEFMEYHLRLHPEDVGCVIGRHGRVAQAIRTILYSVKDSGDKRVRLIIDGLES